MKIQEILIAVLAFSVAGHSQQIAQVYCGRNLAEKLASLCEKDYLFKRSVSKSVSQRRSGYNSVHFGYRPEYGWPWLTAARAHGLRGARGKRQIVSECCDKPCTDEVLLTYCSST